MQLKNKKIIFDVNPTDEQIKRFKECYKEYLKSDKIITLSTDSKIEFVDLKQLNDKTNE